jgi:hypothetical protein
MDERVSNFHIIERWFLNLGCAALIIINCEVLLRVLLTLLWVPARFFAWL